MTASHRTLAFRRFRHRYGIPSENTAALRPHTVPSIHLGIGQSHIDLAWLWTHEETKRKSARTYSNQIRLMERYPDYKFLLCSPTVLENLKEYYPELFTRVKELAGEGFRLKIRRKGKLPQRIPYFHGPQITIGH